MFIHLFGLLFWSLLGAALGWFFAGQASNALGAWLGSLVWGL